MRSCWSHSDDTGNLITPGVILLGALCMSSIIAEATNSANSASYITGLFAFFALLYALPILSAFISARKYRLCNNGLTLVYPFGIERFYAWDVIAEIALCKVHYAAGNTKHILAIRCAIGSDQCVPRNATASREWWSSMAYELIHFKNLVSIYYSEDRYSEFLIYCPKEIKDYRAMRDI